MRWSFSVHTAMRRCQRLLVFAHVMASHNARDPERREAYIVKQFQHLSAWQGNLVHKVLATAFLADLRAARPINPTALTEVALDLALRQFAFSAARRYYEVGQTKRAAGDEYCALSEHEYGWEFTPGALRRVYANVVRCFKNLAAQTKFLAHLYAGLEHVAEQPLTFRLNGATVAATPDLIFLRPSGQPTVVDWKVVESETSDYSRQVLIYALAVARSGQWPGVSAEAIQLYEVNLLKNQVRQHPVTAERLEETEDFIYRSTVELETLIGNGRFGDLDLDEFEVAEKPATCSYCNFRLLCIRRLEAAGRYAEARMVQRRLW
jgi:PD-(D/E)XK nuclease superfamily